jgi:PKD repeat protein
MNIPQIYLVEPYNAYAPKGQKKHWHEIVEEQALMERIIAEQMALQEAQSRTLPSDAPNTSVATVAGNAAGAGGQPPFAFFHPELDLGFINFDRTPASGDGPLTVEFSNFTPTPQYDIYLWNFGDGTTSSDLNPTHVYQSGSNPTNVYTASLQVSSSVAGGAGIGVSPLVYISASKPTVTAGFTFTTSSNSTPSIATFTNTTVNSSQTPTTTYLWIFGSGSLTSTSATPTPITYRNAGPYTASLQATGSYGLTSFVTRSWRIT